MDSFTYHNIFATKGIEYIIIITFLLLLVPFWIFVNRQKVLVAQIQTSLSVLTAAILKIPKGIFYNKNHTWAHIEKSGMAEVGIDDWLLHLAGDAKFTQLKKSGEDIKKGDLMTEIENHGKVLRIFSPLSGKVVYTNPKASEVPQLISSNPYTDGWLYKIEPSNWKEETSHFYMGSEAKKWLKQELVRFKDFVAVSLGDNSPLTSMVILQEGGELLDYSLAGLSDAVWHDFQKEFLDN